MEDSDTFAFLACNAECDMLQIDRYNAGLCVNFLYKMHGIAETIAFWHVTLSVTCSKSTRWTMRFCVSKKITEDTKIADTFAFWSVTGSVSDTDSGTTKIHLMPVSSSQKVVILGADKIFPHLKDKI